jgi:GTP cyclohydrolase I
VVEAESLLGLCGRVRQPFGRSVVVKAESLCKSMRKGETALWQACVVVEAESLCRSMRKK